MKAGVTQLFAPNTVAGASVPQLVSSAPVGTATGGSTRARVHADRLLHTKPAARFARHQEKITSGRACTVQVSGRDCAGPAAYPECDMPSNWPPSRSTANGN